MKKRGLLGALIVLLMFGMSILSCDGGEDDSNGNDPGGNNPGGNNPSGGKVTISLLSGSGSGNIKLKLSEGTWNANATQSSNLSNIMGYLVTSYSSEAINRSQCTATLIENNTALNIELRINSGLLAMCGEVHTASNLNPVTFPYTSHGTVSLSEKFQVTGNPVSFVNGSRLYSDNSAPWASGSLRIIIRESQIEFILLSGSSYVYGYNISGWRSSPIDGNYRVSIDVSNGKKTSGYGSPPSCITDKTSFTFTYEAWNNSILIRQANGSTFSGTDGWQNSFIK